VRFVGSFERQIDDKGRLALPAPHRALLGERCYLVKGAGKCIEVWPEEVFDEVADLLIADSRHDPEARAKRRATAASAIAASPDKQGRVNLPDPLRSWAGITGERQVTIAGNLDHLDIWDPPRFARKQAIGDEQLDDADQEDADVDGGDGEP